MMVAASSLDLNDTIQENVAPYLISKYYIFTIIQTINRDFNATNRRLHTLLSALGNINRYLNDKQLSRAANDYFFEIKKFMKCTNDS